MNDRVYNHGVERLRSDERIERLEVERVVEICLEDKSIKSVLDVGTGSGLFAEAFSKRNVKISGVDTNHEMLEAARKHLPETEFKEAPAEKLPFDNNSFDLVFLGLVFHEVNDYSGALKEAGRTAAREVAILEWYHKEEDFGPPINHRLSEEFIRKLAKENGFSQVEVVNLKNLVLYKLIK
jgi:ubiquinone/menaquinone biosynthesis C-methylase UbiE